MAQAGSGATFLGHPRGLVILFLTEMWERFSYYGMRSMLIFYLTQHFLFGDTPAYGIYSAYISMIYISPIIGEFSSEETKLGFIPPQAGKLMELAKSGNYPSPKNCEIHVGDQDWQSDPKSVQRWAGMLGISTAIVPDTGHMLGKAYVSAILDRWLPAT